MKRNRTYNALLKEGRTQRNRILTDTSRIGETVEFNFSTGVLPPGCTFTRSGTNATNVVGELNENLLIYSEDLQNNTGWPTANRVQVTVANATAPFGAASNATRIQNNSGSASIHALKSKSYSITSGVNYTFSVYAKADGLPFLGITIDNSQARITFNLSTGQVGTSYANPTTGAIQDVGNGWYRCSFWYAATSTASPLIWLNGQTSDADPAASFVGDDSNGVIVWGATFHKGRILFPYLPTTTAAITRKAVDTAIAANTPRFEYSPASKKILGLRMEGSGINYIRYSEDQSQTQWAAFGSGVKGGKSNAIVAPDGTMNMNKFTLSSAASGGVYQSFASGGYTMVTNDVVVVSAWVAVESGTANVRFSYFNGATSSYSPNFTATTTPTRISHYFKITSTTAGSNITVENGSDTATTPLLWWGYQLERTLGNSGAAGLPPAIQDGCSSYMPCTTANGTRNADKLVSTATVGGFSFNNASGTLMVDAYYYKKPNPAASPKPVMIAIRNDVSTLAAIKVSQENRSNRHLVAASDGTTYASALSNTLSGSDGYVYNPPLTRQISSVNALETNTAQLCLTVGTSLVTSASTATVQIGSAAGPIPTPNLFEIYSTNDGNAVADFASVIISRIAYAPTRWLKQQETVALFDSVSSSSFTTPSYSFGYATAFSGAATMWLNQTGGSVTKASGSNITAPVTGNYYWSTPDWDTENNPIAIYYSKNGGAATLWNQFSLLALTVGDTLQVGFFTTLDTGPQYSSLDIIFSSTGETVGTGTIQASFAS